MGAVSAADARWMGVALALAERGRGRTSPNPSVGCVIVRDGVVVGRGWTQPGGRPHAEAMALQEAGDAAAGASVYVTLEPCAHISVRGPACADLLASSKVSRVVVALGDPDLRTNGKGLVRLAVAGIETIAGVRAEEARATMAGFLTRQASGRPHVTLKLATSLDGCIAREDGESRWITGAEARAHCHLERSRHEAILVGRNTWETDRPKLDVRLSGLESRSPLRVILSSGSGGTDPVWLDSPASISRLPGDHLFVEGGAGAAAAFLAQDLVDRLILYRAPILIGRGRPALGDIGLATLADAHGRWTQTDARQLGRDRLEVYERVRCLRGS
ncbi:bifunctional diaminohydroxyphosphoribosylaminopyrimidine deaminase/5-amino-6-(5-phosphoribosylamino)uracil reductase RibD [Sphingomonas sp. IC-11]|uniref:bifunctional diaminohydroxyphosphoribosylaminopyrimidine deaminase/5-amino-6-(5-phosphoribosylamino)uracil reductase RibD n=1 Tax=Sphingomonas sp. IC-11 TaxID=2898528 RepID=UPI003FA69534